MWFPAQARLGSVPNPAVGAGREAQVSLLGTEWVRECPLALPGVARGRWQGRGGEDTPNLCGFVV